MPWRKKEQPTKTNTDGAQDVVYADTPDCAGEQNSLRLGASRPHSRKSGFNKCHWSGENQQRGTDDTRESDTSPNTVFTCNHESLLEELGAPRPSGVLPLPRSSQRSNDS